MTDKPTLDQLLAEFDEKMTDDWSEAWSQANPMDWDNSYHFMEKMMKQAYQAGRESVLEDIEGMKKNNYNIYNPNCPGLCATCGVNEGALHKADCEARNELIYNQALDDLLTKLDNKSNKRR